MRLVRGAVFGDDYEVNDEVLSGAVDDDFFFFDLFGELTDFNFLFLDCCTAECALHMAASSECEHRRRLLPVAAQRSEKLEELEADELQFEFVHLELCVADDHLTEVSPAGATRALHARGGRGGRGAVSVCAPRVVRR